MKSIKELIKIDEEETIKRIENYIRSAVDKEGLKGVIMGLSGGIDSALTMTLAVRSLGKERVSVYFLYDKNSEKDSEKKARLMADWVGLKLNFYSIEARMREKEKDAPFFRWLSSLPRFAPAIIASLYYIIVGETPYITTLRQKEIRKSRFKRWAYDNIMKGVETMFDGPCTERRIVLGEIAKKENLLLIGAGNRSEDLTGWFTVDGIDNMPVSPIKDIYKTQVHQLAEYLKIPTIIQRQESSADVLKGATDTLALGMNFDKIDVILYGIEHNMSDSDIMEYGLTEKKIDKIREIYWLSSWKREAPNA